MTQARKLKLRDKLPEWARLVDLDGLKAVAEAEMLEVPNDVMSLWSPHSSSVLDLVDWDNVSSKFFFWNFVDDFFTVEPLGPEAVKAQRRAEIDEQIARLTKEREGL